MKRYIKHILSVAAVLVALGASAQVKTAYFMEGSILRYDMNAALTPQDGYVNMPFIGSLDINLHNNFASVENMIYPYGDGHVTFMHQSVNAKKFLARMPERPNLGTDVNMNFIGFGNYHKKKGYFWSFNWNMRTMADVDLSKDLFRIAKTLGNGIYNMDGKTSLNAMSYFEFAYGFTQQTGWENLVVGGRVKFLIGLAHMEANINKLTAHITPDYARVEAGGEMRANIATLSFEDIGQHGLPMPLENMVDVFESLNFKNIRNFGAAIDLGAEVKLLDKRLKLSLAVNDLGFIHWGKSSIQGTLDDLLLEYRGYSAEKEDWDINKQTDLVVRKTGGKGYYKMLATTLNAGAEYNFFDNLLGVGVLSHTRFWNRAVHTELTVTGTVRPAKWFTAAISHTLLHNKAGIFGLALNFHPRGINFFLGLDYIPTKFAKVYDIPVPRSMKAFNFHFGLAFTPGGKSRGW